MEPRRSGGKLQIVLISFCIMMTVTTVVAEFTGFGAFKFYVFIVLCICWCVIGIFYSSKLSRRLKDSIVMTVDSVGSSEEVKATDATLKKVLHQTRLAVALCVFVIVVSGAYTSVVVRFS